LCVPDTPPASPLGKPEAEIVVDAALARRLLAEQHPDLADEPLTLLAEGWDNVLLRLGADKLIRIPRRAMAARFIAQEQHCLPLLAPRLPLPVPTPLRIGLPTPYYPWRWSVTPFLTGAPLDEIVLADSEAKTFGAFLKALHAIPPDDTPINPYRGGPLTDRLAAYDDRAERLRAKNLLSPTHDRIWSDALAAAPATSRVWLHGDLHPLNLLGENGRITAVIDWGDVCGGDPATDLAAIWVLFANPAARHIACEAYGPISAGTLARARGWAVYFGVVHLDSGLTNAPRHVGIGEAILRNLITGD
jgi:aminoglycoside phosphotransferase (APT) family kinase protein